MVSPASYMAEVSVEVDKEGKKRAKRQKNTEIFWLSR